VRGMITAVVVGMIAFGLLCGLIVLIHQRWQTSHPAERRRGMTPEPKPTGKKASGRTEWHERLDELHFLLVQVMASDGTLTQISGLPQNVADKIRKYFGASRTVPVVRDKDVVARVMLLEEWLIAVHASVDAALSLSPLPIQLTQQIDTYLEERRRRLGA
jgi:hypothetical protein